MPMRRGRWTGDEHCGFCLQSYVLELEVHCVDCDRPMCPLCVTRGRVALARVCPQCAPAGGGTRRGHARRARRSG